MFSFILTLIVFILVIGILVFVHELGHYIAAKKVGIKVEEFAVGMGPKVWGFTKGETEYNVRALPIGGYVKMFGEGDYDLVAQDSFGGKKPSQRLVVLVAGVFMNFILAVILLYAQAFHQDFKFRNIEGIFKDEYKPWFGEKTDKLLIVREISSNSPLNEKVSTFDIITRINGQKYNVDDISDFLLKNRGKEVNLTLVGYSSSKEKEISLEIPKVDPELIGKDDTPLVVIQGITKDSPLNGKANVFDLIKKINGESYNSKEFRNIIESNKGKEVTLTLANIDGSGERDVNIQLENKDRPLGIVLTYNNTYDGLLGISSGQISFIEFNGGMRIFVGIAQALNIVQNFGFSLGQLWNQALEDKSAVPVVDNVGGAIGIFEILSKIIVLFGFWGVIELMTLFSINLAILNILPIPALDGGHVFFTLLEMLTKRKLDTKVYNYITLSGFVLLMSFMLFITTLDLVKYTQIRSWFCDYGRNTPFICDLSDFRD